MPIEETVKKYFDKLLLGGQPSVKFREYQSVGEFKDKIDHYEQYPKMVIFDEAYKKSLTGKSDEELLCMADILANAEFKLIRKLTFESLVKERDAQHEAGNAQEHTQKPQDRRSTESQGNNTAKEENAPEEGCDDDRHVALILRDCLPIMSNYPTLTALTASYNLLMRKFSLCCVHGERKTLEKLAKQIYNSLLEEIETWQK